MNRIALLLAALLAPVAVAAAQQTPPASYYSHAGHDDVLTGGVKMIPIDTPKGRFRV